MRKDQMIYLLNIAFRTITPWRKTNIPVDSYENGYKSGWNDCLKEIKKNRKNYLNQIENL